MIESLVKSGHVSRGFLGVEIQDLNSGLAQAFKINGTQGALVSEVTPGSAAATAGLQSGDVIVQFNDQSVQDASQLKLQVAETCPGITVPIRVVRDGEKKTLSVTLKEQPNNEMASANSQDPIENGQNAVDNTAKPTANETLVKVWRQESIYYISVPSQMSVS